MKCPSCKETNLSMSERLGIEIDYCPDCRGVWLDRGELDKILEKAASDKTSSILPREKVQEVIYRDSDYLKKDHKDYYHPKRKKSFLEELFD
jgi:uncharacterized protein